jgi:hypothetical protein
MDLFDHLFDLVHVNRKQVERGKATEWGEAREGRDGLYRSPRPLDCSFA